MWEGGGGYLSNFPETYIDLSLFFFLVLIEESEMSATTAEMFEVVGLFLKCLGLLSQVGQYTINNFCRFLKGVMLLENSMKFLCDVNFAILRFAYFVTLKIFDFVKI